MSGSIFGASLSGLDAVNKRLQSSANNIANAHSTRQQEAGQEIRTPYQPTDVVSTTTETGSVISHIQENNKQPQLVYDPQHIDSGDEGFVALPNVNQAEELQDIILARRAFEANLSVIKRTDQTLGSLLDINE